MKIFSSREYLFAGVRPARTRVGAVSYTPILPEPAVVTHDGAVQYNMTILGLSVCLSNDGRANLVYLNPSEAGAEAQNNVIKAAELDGCTDYYFECPEPSMSSSVPWPNQLAAKVLRDKAALAYATQKEMLKRAEDRGIKNDAKGNARVLAEIQFMKDVSDLTDEIVLVKNDLSTEIVAGGSSWKKVQNVDTKYQVLRARYESFGLKPSCPIPKFTSTAGIPWTPILIAVGLTAAAVLAYRLIPAPHAVAA